MSNKNLQIVILSVLLSPILGYSQSTQIGIPFVEFFSTEDYNGGIQNYRISQDPRGIILVANNKGMLTYDGSEWRRYTPPTSSRVRSILPVASGKIYTGGQNDIGYFFPNTSGEYNYHSLSHLLPTEHSKFDDIWNIYSLDEGYVFANVKDMFIYNNEAIRVVPLERLNVLTFLHNGMIYNQVMEKGLMYFKNAEWHMHPQGSFFRDKEIRSITQYSEKYDLVSTSESGLYLVSKYEVLPWATEYLDVFNKYGINIIKRLNDGRFAIGTNLGGLYLFNTKGELDYHFTKGKGLKSRNILDVFEDSFGNIWLGHNNGISKIEWSSPFRYLNEEVGLVGTGYVSFSTEDYLYVGTNNGMYAFDLSQKYNSEGFIKIKGIEGQVYNIQQIDKDILVSCHLGAYQIKGTNVQEISSGVGWWTFIETRDPNIIIGGGYNGLFLLKRLSTNWEVIKHYTDFTESSRVMEFDRNNTLWMSHGYKGVYSFKFSDNYEEITQTRFYGKSKGFPSNLGINVFKYRDENIFTTLSGIYVYDQDSDSFTAHDELNDLVGSDSPIFYLTTDSFGTIYFISDSFSGLIQPNNIGYTFHKNAFSVLKPFLNDDLERISVLNNGLISFAARDGLITYDKSIISKLSTSFGVLLSEVYLPKADSVLHSGNFVYNDRVVNYQPEETIPELIYKNNSINFHYSAIDFNHSQAKYRYQLEGYESKWSDWTSDNSKEYTNLFEGDYSFKIQAMNSSEELSKISQYKFSVIPPWYRSRSALAIYTVLVLGSISAFLYYTVKHKKVIVEQEKELIIRDNKFKEVSQKSDEEITKLKNEKLLIEIRHKRKELANNAMHLIDKNEFINSIKKHVNELLMHPANAEQATRLKRIIKDIDLNIKEDKDWDQFEIHFDEVHEGFTKKLKNQYPAISAQEIKLSIYLRMNLSSKEIANLLRVTTRAVEMARYRLRKKLALGKEVNLVEFLMEV